jgi:hypothetical protein
MPIDLSPALSEIRFEFTATALAPPRTTAAEDS